MTILQGKTCIRSGPGNQTKGRSVHKLFAGAFSGTEVQLVTKVLDFLRKTPEFTKMGEIHELFVLALSLVWFVGATPECKLCWTMGSIMTMHMINHQIRTPPPKRSSSVGQVPATLHKKGISHNLEACNITRTGCINIFGDVRSHQDAIYLSIYLSISIYIYMDGLVASSQVQQHNIWKHKRSPKAYEGSSAISRLSSQGACARGGGRTL